MATYPLSSVDARLLGAPTELATSIDTLAFCLSFSFIRFPANCTHCLQIDPIGIVNNVSIFTWRGSKHIHLTNDYMLTYHFDPSLYLNRQGFHLQQAQQEQEGIRRKKEVQMGQEEDQGQQQVR